MPVDDQETKSLRWGIKDSFIAYLDSLPDASFRVEGGARETVIDGRREWVFPFVDSEEGPSFTQLNFAGELRISAHGGALLVVLMRPGLRLMPDRAELSFVDLMRWPDTSQRELVGEGAGVDPSTDAHDVSVPLRLTVNAAEIFNGIYPAGTAMAPVILERG